MLFVAVGGAAELASGQVGMAAAMEEEREAQQAAREGQQVELHVLVASCLGTNPVCYSCPVTASANMLCGLCVLPEPAISIQSKATMFVRFVFTSPCLQVERRKWRTEQKEWLDEQLSKATGR